MRERIKQVMSDLWGIPVSDIPDDATPESLSQWDSIRHLQFVMALEAEFQVRFTAEEMIELRSLASFERYLTEHAGAPS